MSAFKTDNVVENKILLKLKEIGQESSSLGEYVTLMVSNKKPKDKIRESLCKFITDPGSLERFLTWLFTEIIEKKTSAVKKVEVKKVVENTEKKRQPVRKVGGTDTRKLNTGTLKLKKLKKLIEDDEEESIVGVKRKIGSLTVASGSTRVGKQVPLTVVENETSKNVEPPKKVQKRIISLKETSKFDMYLKPPTSGKRKHANLTWTRPGLEERE